MLKQHHVHILAGASGSGKSLLLLQQLTSWFRKTPYLIPELSLDAFKRIAWIVGDRPDEMRERLEANDLPTTGRIHLYDMPADITFHKEWLCSEVAFHHALLRLPKDGEPFDFVVLDPMAAFLEGMTNNYKHMAQALLNMTRYAKAHGLTVLPTHHANKARSDFKFQRAQDFISGSSALAGFSSTQIALRTPEELGAEFHELTVVSHTAPAVKYQLTLAQGGRFVPWVEPRKK